MELVIFACRQNAGRSQMAKAFFTLLADPSRACAISAGTRPAERVHPEVEMVMQEVGVELAGVQPQRLTRGLAAGACLLVTMGCGEECPFVPGVAVEDWALPDPHDQPLARVREIRDTIRAQVADLIARRGWR